ncbi:MAG: malto-oligosyltrehalose synthase [Thermodesulfobacteriota bacterium]|nr:malto-oligosyltrehalose synthase [Thermodesulfobacteriota bacterium]
MKIPIATYRIQFNPSFGFVEAKAITEYLSELGISNIYASPIFKARKGSLHGYDVVDPNQLNPDLGTWEEFFQLIEGLKGRGMEWLQDIVPNHMAYDYENEMLMDVLENGSCSKFFSFFDIKWNHPYQNFKGALLAPFLGKFYGESLEDREIQLRYNEKGFFIRYFDLSFPLRIESYAMILTYGLDALKRKLGGGDPDFIKLLGILYVLKTLSSQEEPKERYDQINFIKRIIWEIYTTTREIKEFIDRNVETFNGGHGEINFQLLDGLLSEQFFRLSFWKVAAEEVNYRRFFNINELISLRMEDDDAFRQNHGLIFQLGDDRKISGLRVDHIDGLYNPMEYLNRLRRKMGNIYIIVEKILDLEEDLPRSWPVEGTTGYDFMNYVTGVLCQKENQREFTKIYTRFTDVRTQYADMVYEKKRLITEKHMAGDIDNLAQLIKQISSADRHGRDITLYGLKRAIVEIMSVFPVYRTYICPEFFSESDRKYIKEAVKMATKRNPALLHELEFIERFLLLRFEEYLSQQDKDQWAHFVMRFQQFTGPLTAKGFEDTTLYVYNRLLSLNEVGGSPDRFGISLGEFHGFNERRAKSFPLSLNATSTHDAKRGEDVRARINVLSEIPGEWAKKVRQWSRLNRKKKHRIQDMEIPDRNDEYFLYQTLVGSFPFNETEYETWVERIKAYVIKSVREAKVHTAWLKPDMEYEDAFLSFVEEILTISGENQFLTELISFQKKAAYFGMFNSLSQTLIKLTAPGVPDFYQGAELWDLNLADPDNRRPVDFERRLSYLKEIKERSEKDIIGFINDLTIHWQDGKPKLFLIYRVLLLRNRFAKIFQKGTYLQIDVDGMRKDHVIAYARNFEQNWAMVIVPRFVTCLTDEGTAPLGRKVWADTSLCLPDVCPVLFYDAITGQVVSFDEKLFVGDIFNLFPVSLLTNMEVK